jgi:NAD(P)-dependent dehydrogenase (short-subunit alcohol dehydrogenase family)
VGGAGLALELTAETWDQTFDVNVRGVFFAAREAARRMLASGVAGEGRGRIVNIASIAADEALPGLAAYSASKASVAMITRSLAREWARRGIAVNAIAPGYIETELNADWLATEGGRAQIAGFPRRRIMPASSLDATLLMLTGPQSAYITGSIITIDDGQSL